MYVFGMVQYFGEISKRMLKSIKKETMEPLIKSIISLGKLIYTDEYCIYSSHKKRETSIKTFAMGEAIMRVMKLVINSMEYL